MDCCYKQPSPYPSERKWKCNDNDVKNKFTGYWDPQYKNNLSHRVNLRAIILHYPFVKVKLYHVNRGVKNLFFTQKRKLLKLIKLLLIVYKKHIYLLLWIVNFPRFFRVDFPQNPGSIFHLFLQLYSIWQNTIYCFVDDRNNNILRNVL